MPNNKTKAMNVGELIVFLSSFPKDMEILIPIQFCEDHELTGGEIVKNSLVLHVYEKRMSNILG